MGFRLMRPFHEALLGKPLAKFVAKPSSLWAQVIRHKYRDVENCFSSLEAVMRGSEILKHGLKWEVGDGSMVPFFKYPWVSSCPLMLWPRLLGASEKREELLVQDFILPGRQWNQARLIDAVGSEVAKAICKIPLPHSVVADRVRFLGSDLSEFSVSKACRLITSDFASLSA